MRRAGAGPREGSLQLQRPCPSVLLRTKPIPGFLQGGSLRLGPGCPAGPPHLWAWLVAPDCKESVYPIQETWVRFLGRKDPLEEEIATHRYFA